ncbi:MAG: hypothetical protein O7D91_05695 [Planctomycetota bacterium]|nr:hypothetical protein [Planctomycetota bacterium]
MNYQFIQQGIAPLFDGPQARSAGRSRTLSLFRKRLQSIMLLVCVTHALALCGCGPTEEPIAIFLPMPQAIDFVNRNNEQIRGRLYGLGRWSGKITFEDGTFKTADGTFRLHYGRPSRLCFQTRGFGGKYFEVGCNEDVCWFWEQFEKDVMTIGTRQAMTDAAMERGIPINAEELMDALGVLLVDPDTTGTNGARYRVDADHHQLLYEQVVGAGQAVITKEYWLSRREPFLIERVLYRDADGRVIMDARLADYKRLAEGGALVSKHVEIEWPLNQCALKLNFDRLKLYGDLDKIEFVSPDRREALDPRQRPPAEIVRRP